METLKKRQKEKTIVKNMIALYCRKKHISAEKNSEKLCAECQSLLDYAQERIEKCPFMEDKTFCSQCKVHCYQAKKREKIRLVMKYAGPRMIFFYPRITLSHGIATLKGQWKKRKKQK